KKIELSDVFVHRDNLREYLIGIINQQIELEIRAEGNAYFEDYTKLVRENFKMNNFFITKEGVVLYYQEYEIAPYSSGLPTFLIPYGEEGAVPPKYC
ncbi:MAG TPA: RsiV family protein, partial [Mobilitalea sp.]|nr:RsiV family protein [Mobilitalea sp.]